MKKLQKLFTLLILATNCITLPQRCYRRSCIEPLPQPTSILDVSEQFNEKRYWIEENERTGDMQICYKRILLYPDFYQSPDAICFPTKQIKKSSHELPENARCYYADGIKQGLILCKKKNGALVLYTNAEKQCSTTLPSKNVIGTIASNPHGTCTVTIGENNAIQTAEYQKRRSTNVHTQSLANIKRTDRPSPRTFILSPIESGFRTR